MEESKVWAAVGFLCKRVLVKREAGGSSFSARQTFRDRNWLPMLREHINDIMIRWSPKERRGSSYDPVRFVETPEQARKLINHLENELEKAQRERNAELVSEMGATLAQVERLAKKFFRWEENMSRRVNAEDLREIKKLPLSF